MIYMGQATDGCNRFSSVFGLFVIEPSSPSGVPRAQPPKAIATPCIKVCVVDGASGLCLGCFRTLSEIGGWTRLTDEQRATVMTDLPNRRSLIDPKLLG
jgi:uncharacterized protein